MDSIISNSLCENMEFMTSSKVTYITAWTEAIKELRVLGFCVDVEHSEIVNTCIDKLLEVLPKIAETKDFK